MGKALQLLNSVIAFALHAIFPLINISQNLGLEETASFDLERNDWVEKENWKNQSEPALIPVDHKVHGLFLSNI
jgi:hypothetical protein